MNSLCILLTDSESINQDLILKSKKKLLKSKLKKIYFIGDLKLFPKIYLLTKLNKKFLFINQSLFKNNYINYLKKITNKSINLYKEKKIKYLINMPLNKKKFLEKKYLGYTELYSFLFDKKKNENMLLYNKKFSVCPLTTHIKIKDVDKNINKYKLINAIKNILLFSKNILKKNYKIVVLGLNPHASIDMKSNTKDAKVVRPIVLNLLKKKIDIQGPISADTAFLKTSNKIYLGMYHDQVLIPFKMRNAFNGINITIGKKLIRLSPNHGTGVALKNKINKIDNKSFLECIKFCEKH